MIDQNLIRITAVAGPECRQNVIQIRLLDPTDIEGVLELQIACLRHKYGRNFRELPRHLKKEDVISYAFSPSGVVLVAQLEDSKKISGCFFVSPLEGITPCTFSFNQSSFVGQNNPFVDHNRLFVGHNLLVTPRQRGFGLGSALIRSALEHLRTRSIKPSDNPILLAQIQANNTNACRAAFAAGFQMIGYSNTSPDRKNPALLFSRMVGGISNDNGNLMPVDSLIIDVTNPTSSVLEELKMGAIGMGCITRQSGQKLFVFTQPQY